MDFKEITIEYILPENFMGDNDVVVEVLGTFTNWCPYEMRRDTNDANKYLYDVSLKRGYKHRYHFMVNGEDMVDETKKTIMNRFGNMSNFVSVPLVKLEKSLKGDLSSFIMQDLNYLDSVDYPVFLSQESALLIKKRTTSTGKQTFSDSLVKRDVSNVRFVIFNFGSYLLKKFDKSNFRTVNPDN